MVLLLQGLNMDIKQKDLFHEFAKADEQSRNPFTFSSCLEVLNSRYDIKENDLDANAKSKIRNAHKAYKKHKQKYSDRYQ